MTTEAADLELSSKSDSLLEIESQTFQRQFDVSPFLIQHQLSGHPLFQLPRLITLAKNLPADLVEYNAGDLAVDHDPTKTPMNGLSVEETIERIETCRSWLVLKYVDKDPEYSALLQRCLREIETHSEAIDPGMCQHEAYIFISSPHSVTPFHIDPEHNFLLQIRGSKTIHIWDRSDPVVMPAEAWHRYYLGSHRNQEFVDSFQPRATSVNLSPGLGVHLPVVAPHWVQNGPEVSISFSITFRTPATKRKNAVNRLNAKLRQRGLSPRAYGESPILDRCKHAYFRAVTTLQNNIIVRFIKRGARFALKKLSGVSKQWRL